MRPNNSLVPSYLFFIFARHSGSAFQGEDWRLGDRNRKSFLLWNTLFRRTSKELPKNKHYREATWSSTEHTCSSSYLMTDSVYCTLLTHNIAKDIQMPIPTSVPTPRSRYYQTSYHNVLQDFRGTWPGMEFKVLFLLLLLTLALLNPLFYFQIKANGLCECLHSGFLGQEWPTLKDSVIEFSCFEFVPTQERWDSHDTVHSETQLLAKDFFQHKREISRSRRNCATHMFHSVQL